MKFDKKDEGVSTRDKFSPLQNDERFVSQPSLEEPPAIYLRQRSAKELIKTLKVLTENNFSAIPIKKGNIEEVKIQVAKFDAYIKVTVYSD